MKQIEINENMYLMIDEEFKGERPIIVAVRDRGSIEEKWILTTLSVEDTRKFVDFMSMSGII